MSPARAKARRLAIGNALADYRSALFSLAAEMQDVAVNIDGEYEDVSDWLHHAAYAVRLCDVGLVKAVEALQARATEAMTAK